MNFSVGFGKSIMNFSVDDRNLLGVLEPNAIDTAVSGVEEVRRAMREPIGSKRLRDIVKRGERIVIITSDITRPMPSRLVLPEVLAELSLANTDINDITVVFALGSHRKHTEEEKKHLAGEDIYTKIKCVDSNPDDSVHLGRTSGGTPVDIFRLVAKADRRICLGNIEYHYFAGYSGGAKACNARSFNQGGHTGKPRQDGGGWG